MSAQGKIVQSADTAEAVRSALNRGIAEILASRLSIRNRGAFSHSSPLTAERVVKLLLTARSHGSGFERDMQELLENVSVHALGATAIWLGVRQESERAVVTVEDDGCGIPEARLIPLMRGTPLTAAAKETRTGGVGLSLCRSILQAHGGEMHIGNGAHGGASVRFTLPCSEAAK